MLFNSFAFFVFLPIVFILYWFVFNKNLNRQNLVLLIASYWFYGWWDFRFLFLLAFSTLLDYYTGLKMGNETNPQFRKFWLRLSITINVGFLAIFKYFNFFSQSFVGMMSHFGIHVNPWTLQVILPVGISFYTFHGLSYVLDVYHNRIPPEKKWLPYAVFVGFFPLLVAGPIERATHLLPQIKKPRVFEYGKAADGLKQILWGLFKKVVIADNLSTYVNNVFGASDHFSGSSHILAAIFFAFQIYCDFSGYSDIAIGVARLFGIELLRNFSYPYFSRDIAEFWRRWHISLSSWFRDYLYIPLGGSRTNNWRKALNISIVFIVSGFWHGANWTFIFWGLLNAFYIMPLVLLNKNRANLDIVAKGKMLPSFREFVSMGLTFTMVCFAWIFFRSPNLSSAFSFASKMFTQSALSLPILPDNRQSNLAILFLPFMIGMEWLGRAHMHALENFWPKLPRTFRWAFYCFLILLIFDYSNSDSVKTFIYFQF